MSIESAVKMMKQIDEVEELTVLVDAREAARRVYATMQDFAHATGNPLFLDYMRIIAKAGQTINDDIGAWAKRQEQLHASGIGQADEDGGLNGY